MKFKNLILVLLILILGLLVAQNSAPVSIVIFGTINLNVPLSLAILFALFGGLLSSIFIQIVIRMSMPKPQDYSNYNKPVSEPPPPYEPQESVRNTPKTYQDNYQPVYQSEYSQKYEPTPEITVEKNNFNVEKESLQNNFEKETNKIENNYPPEEIDNIETSNINPEKQAISEPELEVNINPNPRQAAPYSYQPKERTEIVPKTTKLPPKQSTPKNRTGDVYDATYRVITPAYDENDDNYNFDEDDDDWDF